MFKKKTPATPYTLGNLFTTPSGLGGTYTAKYIGRDAGKLKFQITNPGHERCIYLTEEAADKRMTIKKNL